MLLYTDVGCSGRINGAVIHWRGALVEVDMTPQGEVNLVLEYQRLKILLDVSNTATRRHETVDGVPV